jgi:hypothetical protein
MIGWSNICPVLIDVFTTAAVDTARLSDRFAAEWKEGQRGITHDQQKLSLLLKVTSVVGIGTDEERYEYVDPSSTDPADQPYLGNMRTSAVGQRKFTLQVQAIVPEHTDVQWAMAATERIRTRICRTRVTDYLIDNDISIIDIKQAVKTSFRDNGRVVSCASMDFILGTVVNDDDPIPTGWIQQITVTSDIVDVDGLTLPSPPNVEDEPIPASI